MASAGGEEEDPSFPLLRFRGFRRCRLRVGRGVGVSVQDYRRDVAPSACRRGFSVFQGFICPEAGAVPVSVSSDAFDHQGVVFFHAPRQQEEGVRPSALGFVEMVVQLSFGDAFQAVSGFPEEHAVDLLVCDVVVHVYC